MSTGKLLEFFIRIPKLLPDGSNWVIFKDRFHFAAAAAVLQKHLDGTDSEPAALAFPVAGPTPLTAASASTDTITIEELHRLMGHISPQVARSMVTRGMVEGIKLDESSEIKSCDSCEYAKAHRKPIAKVREAKRADEVGE